MRLIKSMYSVQKEKTVIKLLRTNKCLNIIYVKKKCKLALLAVPNSVSLLSHPGGQKQEIKTRSTKSDKFTNIVFVSRCKLNGD